jgi:hypothetical protein
MFAAALTLGSAAAFAQTGNTVDDPAQASGPRGVTQQGTDPDGQACTPPGYNQGAGGYPPCSGDMAGTGTGGTGTGTGGTGMSGGTGGGMSGGTGGGMSAGNLPACSRTVTDRCRQTYERGVRRR